MARHPRRQSPGSRYAPEKGTMPSLLRDPIDVDVDVAARPNESRKGLQRTMGVTKMVQHADCHDEVERCVAKRQLLRVGLHRHHVGGQVPPCNVDGVTHVDGYDSGPQSMR